MKVILSIIVLLTIIPTACRRESKSDNENTGNIVVIKLQPMDSEILEEWIRETEEEDILGIGAARTKGDWPWSVFVYAAEFIREDPLESELYQSIEKALESVPGVTDVFHEDREKWIIKGNPRGEDLVRACSLAVDKLSSAIREVYESLK